ncbi:YciI-like protein [Lewinella sp. JB7]|uniref:YciI-like protein n=1 Tax=Lewinella sp. JB7 TaxID=2962887 RepID=UPI0020CA02A0|nr:YciI-like protein [Lewinella sp. JB7]MCP9234569.1 YciI-like protein [Lewinella sp. JB7]
MNYYILFYEAADGYVERRQPYRDTHLNMARRAREEGSLILAGAYEPADGAALVFRGESAEVAESFARQDPYVQNGLVTRWWVKQWDVVVE